MVVAGSNTPSEFTTEQKGGFAFNPEFLKRMGYDKLNDLSVLIPRKNLGPWEKIGFKGASVSGGEIEGDSGKAPPAPGSLQASKDTISWSGAKGHLIVGYRIYHSPGDDGSYKLVGHTVKPSYAIPSGEGSYHVRAVNYFGQESDPSKTFTVEVGKKETDEKEKEEKKEKKKEKKEKKNKNKNQNKDKKQNKGNNNKEKPEKNKGNNGRNNDDENESNKQEAKDEDDEKDEGDEDE